MILTIQIKQKVNLMLQSTERSSEWFKPLTVTGMVTLQIKHKHLLQTLSQPAKEMLQDKDYFGTLCATGTTTNTAVGVDVGDTSGIALPLKNLESLAGQNGTQSGALTTACALQDNSSLYTGAMNVVREAKEPNLTLTSGSGTGDDDGQIGINGTSVWPFIQLYPLNPTGNVIVQYNKGGGVQSTTLTFDTVDQFAGASLDKSVFTRNAQVHVTITDLWLNIDPTDEDSWTFGTNATKGTTSNYQVFDENGQDAGAAVSGGIINVQGNFTSMMIEDNGVLILNPDTQGSGTRVLTIQDNDDSISLVLQFKT
jgi:hypothetical protein